jgi:Ca2+-binding EF-hand superfamily protein
MRTSTVTCIVSGLIALTLAACSGATAEPVDQSAQQETAHLNAAPPASGTSAEAANDGKPGHGPGMRGHRGPPDPAEVVKRFDKNADGQLQVSELPEHMQQFMGKADTNSDGVLSVAELKAGEEKMRAEHLAQVDTDHDGKVSPEERKAAFEKFAQARFAKLDKNNDGALTKDEVGDKRWEHLSVADADKNGSVTREEIKTAVAAGTLKFPHGGRGMHGHGGPRGDHEHGSAPNGDLTPPADAPSGT